MLSLLLAFACLSYVTLWLLAAIGRLWLRHSFRHVPRSSASCQGLLQVGPNSQSHLPGAMARVLRDSFHHISSAHVVPRPKNVHGHVSFGADRF